MNPAPSLQSLGFALPSPAYIFGSILFGLIGFAAWRVGKIKENLWTRWLGVVLMFYPYAVTDTRLLYGLGAGLCAALYFTRQR